MIIIAQDTYNKSTQIIDKDKILTIDSWGIYRDEACTDAITSGLNDNSVYYVLLECQNAYDPTDINYISTLTVNLVNGYGTATCDLYSIVTDGSTYKKAKYKLTFGEFSDNDKLDGIDGHVTDSNDAYLGYRLLANNTIYAYILKSNKIKECNKFYNTVIDNDGNYIAVGYSGSIDKYGDAFIAKFDNDLNALSAKVYGNKNQYEGFHNVAVDNDGNYIAIGGVEAGSHIGESDKLIVKFDSNLNILIAKIYGETGYNNFTGIAVDNSGNYIAVAYAGGSALIIKLDSNLNKLAAKSYGGSNNDSFYGVAVDNNGNYIAVGYTSSEGQGNSDALIVKFDSNLNKLAAKSYGGDNDDVFYDIAVDNNENYIAVGYTKSEGRGGYNALIVKFDSNLNKLAAKVYGGDSDDVFYDIAVDNDGNYIVVGYTNSNSQSGYSSLIIKFDSNLNKLADKVYGEGSNGTAFSFNGIIIDNNGNYIVSGLIYDIAFISKIFSLPSGSFTSGSGYIFIDNNLALADSNLTLANSDLTLADENSSLGNSNLGLTSITLTESKDEIK